VAYCHSQDGEIHLEEVEHFAAELILDLLSVTEYKDVKQGESRESIEEFEGANILFMMDRRITCIEKMSAAILRETQRGE
jgi:hypothetical protein